MDYGIKNNQIDDSLLWIKFKGPDLKAKSIPIYELGQTLTAFQVILHKAYLFKSERQKKGVIVTKEERPQLALRIKRQQAGSDEYGLVPFLSDPLIRSFVGGVLIIAFKALGQYVYKKVTGKKNTEESNMQPLVGSIYNQTNIFADRIDNIGGIKSIEIVANKELDIPNIILDETTRDYIREIGRSPLESDTTQIEGVVIRLYARDFAVLVQNKPGEYIKVTLGPEDFNQVRYHTNDLSMIKFEGRYLYWLGKEASKFDYFQADKIVEIRQLKDRLF